jgi:SAM-dependent methyltransferase
MSLEPGIPPLPVRAERLKQAVKVQIGRILMTLMPRLRRKVEDQGLQKFRFNFREATLVERIVFAAVTDRLDSQGVHEPLAEAHRTFWSSERSIDYHKTREARIASDLLGEHLPMVEALEEVLATGRFRALCEIGCGSGYVIDHLAKRWHRLEAFTGIDLSADQIRLNKGNFANPKLNFVAADAADWIDANATPGTAFLTYSGVLEYFTEPALATMLKRLAKCGPVCFALLEPIAREHDLDADPRSHLYGNERSFSHNYPRLFKEAGFTIRWRQELFTHRFLMMVATIEEPGNAAAHPVDAHAAPSYDLESRQDAPRRAVSARRTS